MLTMRGHTTRGRSVVVLSLALAAVALGIVAPRFRPRPRSSLPAPVDATYATSLKPIFDRRCVPCHACFDSPCQLNLQSFEGLDRGANKEIVYFPERPLAARPTRMFQDAKTTAAWQSEFDFFPVVERAHPRDLDRSIFWRFVNQRTREPGGGSFDVDGTTTCAASVPELEKELHDNPTRGMPFGFPPLSDLEQDAIASWLRSGAGGPAPAAGESARLEPDVDRWEDFLNGSDPRTPLVAAYIFEHLFYAHLYFDSAEAAPGEWFRIVRSRTPNGGPIDELPTRRPYDDPGTTPFFYRLRRIRETLVEKTHAPYRLSDAKLARLRQLFFEPKWTAPRSFDRGASPNPFVAFAAIPARARYQFMLDDARYHVQTFIHGPVCRGEAALDVIEEQFLIFFLAPESDRAVTDPDYLPRVAADLEMPAERTGSIQAISPEFDAREILYLDKQAPRARSFADVWHGDGTNRDAVLTVFRHYDNAFVLRGAVGGMPKTAWVLDYPIFERMYYDLVAGFDVYGNLTHQIGTRMYMNYLRIEAEGQFLRLLPASERTRIRDEWYRGRVARALSRVHDKACAGPETTIAYPNQGRAKEELVTRLLTKELPPEVVGPREPIQWADAPLSSDPARARFEEKMRDLVQKPAPYVGPFPDTVLLRVKTASGSDLVYTIARNRSHTSVEFIFSEGVELEPAEDSLQIVSGIASSRPNFFLTVDDARPGELGEFVAAWKALKQGDRSWSAFAARYGARRSDPAFWSTFDFFTGAFSAIDPIGAAALDLSRYTND